MRVSLTIFAAEKQYVFTYSECVFVDFGIQYAMRMAILSSVVYSALQYFSRLSH